MSTKPNLDTLVKVYVAEVIDGDTFKTTYGDMIRLTGINSRELKRKTTIDGKKKWLYDPEPFSLEAKLELEKRILHKPVFLEFDHKLMSYVRNLCYVYTEDGGMINEYMLLLGLAHTMHVKPNLKHRTSFDLAQDLAYSEGRGMWEIWDIDDVVRETR